MLDVSAYLAALIALSVIALGGWIHSCMHRNVNIVDTLWSIFFVAAFTTYIIAATPAGLSPRGQLTGAMVLLWCLRLAIHLSIRNHGKTEDHRYAAIRARNEPGFTVKSLYLVFGLQAVLAWIIAAPLAVAATSQAPLGALDFLGAALWLFGFIFEATADWQLARFKRDGANAGRVMDHGLWRYTRHPNYFGEACLWWGFWLVACSAGGAWTVFSPLIMTVLLLKVSGVALLEKDIAVRRPAYKDYIRRTNAFLPGPPKDPA